MMTAEKHQMAVAKQTLRMIPSAAEFMGGMTFREAYYHVFRTDLDARLAGLVKLYPMAETEFFSWEMDKYGFHSPQELQRLLPPLEPEDREQYELDNYVPRS